MGRECTKDQLEAGIVSVQGKSPNRRMTATLIDLHRRGATYVVCQIIFKGLWTEAHIGTHTSILRRRMTETEKGYAVRQRSTRVVWSHLV